MKLCALPAMAADPGKPALVTPARIYSYWQVGAAIAAMAGALGRAGVRPGQRLVAVHDHDEAAIFLFAAASALGLQLVMPYSLTEATADEWRALVRAARPDHIVDLRVQAGAGGDLSPLCSSVIGRQVLASAGEVADDGAIPVASPDPVPDFLLLFTSGTTGSPKAISLSEKLVCLRVASVSARLGFDATSRIFMTGLLNNTTGVIFSFGAWRHGATLYLPEGRDVARWPAQVARQRLTHMMLRPEALRRFVAGADGADLASLRTVAYGAAAMPRPLLAAARRLMPCDWVQGYGLSESFGPFCWLDEADHRAGGNDGAGHVIGRPDDTLEVRIDAAPGAPGELLLRGDALMRGYIDLASGRLSPPGGWFRTGDLGRLLPEGRLALIGRASHAILTPNGHRIYPEEVEGVLAEIEGVVQSLLLPLPGGHDLGNQPVACVHGPLAFADSGTIRRRIAGALADRLSREKWPAYVYASRDPFPRNPNDKLDRKVVAHGLAGQRLIALESEEAALCR